MHKEVKTFIREVRKNYWSYFFGSEVIDFGSLNINGSCRQFFWFCDYTGVDIGRGKGVDVVCFAHLFPSMKKYDVVLSTEMLEHDKNWRKSLRNMYDCLKPTGLMILTCAGVTRKEHGTARTSPKDSPHTNDYYRNISLEDFEEVLDPSLFEHGAVLKYERDGRDLMFFGIKKD